MVVMLIRLQTIFLAHRSSPTHLRDWRRLDQTWSRNKRRYAESRLRSFSEVEPSTLNWARIFEPGFSGNSERHQSTARLPVDPWKKIKELFQDGVAIAAEDIDRVKNPSLAKDLADGTLKVEINIVHLLKVQKMVLWKWWRCESCLRGGGINSNYWETVSSRGPRRTSGGCV